MHDGTKWPDSDRRHAKFASGLTLLCVTCAAMPAVAQDDVADVPCQDLRVGGNDHMRYFLIGAKDGDKPPAAGYKLLVVLPGGTGDADFNPFVKRIYENALPAGWLVAQPVAVKWSADQQIVWPTRKGDAKGMKFTTQEFVDDVIKEIGAKHRLDARKVFTLSWSSSGPAAYAISLRKNSPVTGSYIAMSVFKPDQLPPLPLGAGHAYYIEHSKEDKVCPFRMAEDAREKLRKAGATVEFATYDGGHGWRGDVFGRIRKGVTWLDRTAGTRTPKGRKSPATREKAKPASRDEP